MNTCIVRRGNIKQETLRGGGALFAMCSPARMSDGTCDWHRRQSWGLVHITLWLFNDSTIFNVAMEHGPFIWFMMIYRIKNGDFPQLRSTKPEGTSTSKMWPCVKVWVFILLLDPETDPTWWLWTGRSNSPFSGVEKPWQQKRSKTSITIWLWLTVCHGKIHHF